ncbi:MAG: cupredoxin domain-containing protein [Nitrosotalea sp.]
MATKFSEGCLLNSDWSGAPCYAIPGLNVTKEQMQKDWSGYYMYKGSQWMETKKIEMINATASGILKAWVCSSPSNYDAWWYYYLNGQAPSIAWSTNGPMCTIPPLQQLKVGAKIGEVGCGYDLYLLVNKKNGMPACVKLASITKLLGLGWEHLATYLDDTVSHSPMATKISITEQDFPSCKLCEGKSENLTVAIGANNTVRWVNTTPSPVWFLTLPNGDDIAFSNSAIFPLSHIGAMKFPAYLYSGQSFEYTFTKPGKFFWHTNPQFMGWVTVLPEPSKNLNDTENETVKVIAIKMVPPYTPGGPAIQLTIQNIGMMPMTRLNVTLVTNQNYIFNFKSVTPTTPLIPGNSISDTTMLIGGGFQTESTYSLIISGMKDNVPFEYLEKVQIQG